MYANVNCKTKKELRDAVKAGHKIGIHQPGPFGGNVPLDGSVCLEGPHYPAPHRWYATAQIENGIIISVK